MFSYRDVVISLNETCVKTSIGPVFVMGEFLSKLNEENLLTKGHADDLVVLSYQRNSMLPPVS